MKEFFNVFVNELIQENHQPGTPIGDAIKDMSAADLIDLFKDKNEPLYSAVEEFLESLLDTSVTDTNTGNIDLNMTY